MIEPVRLHIRRIGAPRWARWDNKSMPGWADMYDVCGEQPEWGWGIPLVHRAVASPSEGLPVPRKPAENCDFSNALGYWAALLHVCLYSLGWVRPEIGLFRMLEAEAEADEFDDLEGFDPGLVEAILDPRVQLIDSVWRRDGDLPLFVAWLATFGIHQYRDWMGEITGQRFDQGNFDVDPRWLDRQGERAGRLRYPTPGPGGDELHLSMHCLGPLAGSSSSEDGRAPDRFALRDDGTATLTVSSMQGWYRTLLLQTAAVPVRETDLAVDVYSQPVGWLGRYRKSPMTGMWHAASEEAHLLGH